MRVGDIISWVGPRGFITVKYTKEFDSNGRVMGRRALDKYHAGGVTIASKYNYSMPREMMMNERIGS